MPWSKIKRKGPKGEWIITHTWTENLTLTRVIQPTEIVEYYIGEKAVTEEAWLNFAKKVEQCFAKGDDHV